MTRKAIHRRSGRSVTPEEFMALEGSRYRERGVYPYCPACGADLHPHGVHSPNVPSSFHHPDRSGCPLSSTPDPRYAYLVPSGWDLEAGKRMRAAFCEEESLKQVYAVCRTICFGRLRASEFVAFCHQADRRNVWAYKDLPLWVAPYILVTLADLPDETGKENENRPRSSHARRYPLRFVLEKPKRSVIDALWHEPEACRLVPVFADSGRPLNKPPIAAGDPEIENARHDTGWITDALLRRLRECCSHFSLSASSHASQARP